MGRCIGVTWLTAALKRHEGDQIGIVGKRDIDTRAVAGDGRAPFRAGKGAYRTAPQADVAASARTNARQRAGLVAQDARRGARAGALPGARRKACSAGHLSPRRGHPDEYHRKTKSRRAGQIAMRTVARAVHECTHCSRFHGRLTLGDRSTGWGQRQACVRPRRADTDRLIQTKHALKSSVGQIPAPERCPALMKTRLGLSSKTSLASCRA
jgi:hypothetical protein